MVDAFVANDFSAAASLPPAPLWHRLQPGPGLEHICLTAKASKHAHLCVVIVAICATIAIQ
jgi:hypothetical protein